MKNVFLIFLGCCLIIGCSLSDDFEEQSVAITDFNLVELTSEKAAFVLFGEWRNTCGSVARFSTRKSGTTITVEMFGKQKKDAICGQAFITISDSWSTSIQSGETYSFLFKGEGSAVLDTTLTAP